MNTRFHPIFVYVSPHADEPAAEPKGNSFLVAKSSRPRDVDTANTLPPLKVPRRVRWTDDEKQAIIDGVNRFGEGKWNAIFKFHHEVFKFRV